MPIRRSVVAVAAWLVLALVLAACDQGLRVVTPPPGEPSATAPQSGEPAESVSPVVSQLGGPWRRSPIVLDDGHIAIFSDACASKARETLGGDAANLPTALVDAQGMSFAIVILADDLSAVECLVDIDPSGDSATATATDWLAADSIAAVDGTAMSVVTYVPDDDAARTIAIGRIGPDAIKAKITFDDASVIQAADAAGWWATWWRGAVAAATFVTTDSKDLVTGHAEKPRGPVDGRAIAGDWWVDPSKPAPKPTSTTVHALVRERACSSGKPATGRVQQPIIEVSADAVTVTYLIRRLPGGQDCPGTEPTPVELVLPEPLGNRKLLDGRTDPPRDAMMPPA